MVDHQWVLGNCGHMHVHCVCVHIMCVCAHMHVHFVYVCTCMYVLFVCVCVCVCSHVRVLMDLGPILGVFHNFDHLSTYSLRWIFSFKPRTHLSVSLASWHAPGILGFRYLRLDYINCLAFSWPCSEETLNSDLLAYWANALTSKLPSHPQPLGVFFFGSREIELLEKDQNKDDTWVNHKIKAVNTQQTNLHEKKKRDVGFTKGEIAQAASRRHTQLRKNLKGEL